LFSPVVVQCAGATGTRDRGVLKIGFMNSLSFIHEFHYVGLFTLLILGGVGFPFPEDVTFILTGILLSNDVIEPIPAFLAVYSGLLIADLILYSAGRKYGRKVAMFKPFRRMLTPERFMRLEYKFATRGTSYILFGRHLPGLRAQLFLVSGVMRMPVLRFLFADAFSALFSVTIWGGAGYLFGYKFLYFKEKFTRIEHMVILPLVGAAIAAGLIYLFIRSRREKRQTAP
jgi:membrane protein DedA with SNARE-associated domain